MPRVSRQQTTANLETIKDVAARLFKERGFDGVSVTDLMAAAGLTHGGFYGHFSSKDALAAIACEHAFAQSVQRRASPLPAVQPPGQERTALLARYLSTAHRDHPGKGCPATALAADVGRQPRHAPARSAYVAGLKAMALDFDLLSSAGDAEQRRRDALVGLATLVGALTLARATSDDPLSAEILAAVHAAFVTPSAACAATTTAIHHKTVVPT